MENLDEKIAKALKAEDAQIRDLLKDEPSIFELMADTYRGRNRFLVYLGTVWGIVVMIFGIYCLLQFLKADDAVATVRWTVGIFFALMMILGMKIWYWMELNRNAMLREIKRVELQVAQLQAKSK
ncbi:hypothetical protein KQI84_15975 [bacterium]|nr:hypothetical protein [bacterium]